MSKLSRTKLLVINMAKLVLMLYSFLASQQVNATDPRAYQHGIDFVKLPGAGYRLFWSSSPGDPPQGIVKTALPGDIKCEYFNHDIYASLFDATSPRIAGSPIVALQEAQEPVSAAVSGRGRILITFEDGSEGDIKRYCEGNIQQRYQLYDSSLEPVTEIKTVSQRGGHSGHVAAVGDYFVISYAEGWIDGGGIDEGGTANDIHLDVVDAQGNYVRHRGVAVDDGSRRDWWPLVSGSNRNALMIWQRIIDGEAYANLMYSVYDPTADRYIKAATLLRANIIFYHYDVQYLPNIKRFLVVGNYLANALLPIAGRDMHFITPRMFAVLLDQSGDIVSQWDGELPCRQCGSYHFYNIVREAQPAMLETDEVTVKVLYPVKPRGVMALDVTMTDIIADGFHDANHYWFSSGTDGIFLNRQTAYFVNLSPTGLKPVTINLKK